MNSDARAGLRKEFKALRLAMLSLDNTLQRLTLTSVRGQVAANRRQRRKVRLSRKARAALVLQGRYMGFMRQLKPRQKAQVRRIKEANGVKAAIESARRLSR